MAGTIGFIAGFVGGMTFGKVAHTSADDSLRFVKKEAPFSHCSCGLPSKPSCWFQALRECELA